MGKKNKKNTPSVEREKEPEVSRVFVVPKKDYEYMLRNHKGKKDYFYFEVSGLVEYVRTRTETGKWVALVTLETYEAHTAELLGRPGKSPSFRTIQRVKKNMGGTEVITFQGLPNNGKEGIRELDRKHAEMEARWNSPKPFMVATTTPMCVLAEADIKRYKQHISSLKSKEILIHPAKHAIVTENGKMETLLGFVVRGKKLFAVSAVDYLAIKDKAPKQGFPIDAGALLGASGVSMRIVKNTQLNALNALLLKEQNLQEKRKQRGKEDADTKPEFDPQEKFLQKPPLDIIKNRQTWHSPLNLSLDLDRKKKIQLYSQKCHCSNCVGRYRNNPIIECTAKVSTKSGQTVPVTVQYCTGCGAFFMNYATYKSYDKKYGGLKFCCQVDAGDLFKMNKDSSFADDSFLSRNGYSVDAKTPRSQRQATLARILDSGIASKYEIMEKISEFISLRKNNPHMADAIDRWEEDIAFVADYKIKKQADAGTREFEQKGKITKEKR